MPVLSELCPDTSLLTPDFDGYKLSLDKIPTYQYEFSTSKRIKFIPLADVLSKINFQALTTESQPLISSRFCLYVPLDFTTTCMATPGLKDMSIISTKTESF